jgi:hypothetical protein
MSIVRMRHLAVLLLVAALVLVATSCTDAPAPDTPPDDDGAAPTDADQQPAPATGGDEGEPRQGPACHLVPPPNACLHKRNSRPHKGKWAERTMTRD